MNQDDFITAIKIAVHDATIKGMQSQLIRPTGRKPHNKLKESSTWFNNLPDDDKKQVMEIILQSVHASIFSMLCVLDGVAAIESTSDKGEIKLTFVQDGESTHLNDPEDEMLHDIYQALVQDEVFGTEH